VACSGVSELRLDQLTPFQGDLKSLSPENCEKLKGEIIRLGFCDPFSVWRSKGAYFILNGHQRLAVLKKMVGEGWEVPALPVVWIEARNKREAKEKILALTSQYGDMTRDGLARFAADNGLALKEVASRFKFGGIKFSDMTVPELKEGAGREGTGADYKSGDIWDLMGDVVFTSRNEWGLPDLLEGMLAGPELIPKKTWTRGELARGSGLGQFFVYRSRVIPPEARGGVLGFYTEDYKFEHLWDDAAKYGLEFKKFGWGALVAPDYSLDIGEALPVQLFNVYRSRWLSRYWQELGIKIIPNLTGAEAYTMDFVTEGIPVGCPVVMMQCRTAVSMRREGGGGERKAGGKQGRARFINLLGKSVEKIKPKNVIIYGGVVHAGWLQGNLPQGPKYHLLESWTTSMRMGLEKRREI